MCKPDDFPPYGEWDGNGINPAMLAAMSVGPDGEPRMTLCDCGAAIPVGIPSGLCASCEAIEPCTNGNCALVGAAHRGECDLVVRPSWMPATVIDSLGFTVAGRTLLEVIDLSIAQINADIAEGLVPPTVASFAALHDHADANEYGGLCDDPWYTEARGDGDSPSEALQDLTIAAQYAVDLWLTAGRPA